MTTPNDDMVPVTVAIDQLRAVCQQNDNPVANGLAGIIRHIDRQAARIEALIAERDELAAYKAAAFELTKAALAEGERRATAAIVAWLRAVDWCSESRSYAEAFAAVVSSSPFTARVSPAVDGASTVTITETYLRQAIEASELRVGQRAAETATAIERQFGIIATKLSQIEASLAPLAGMDAQFATVNEKISSRFIQGLLAACVAAGVAITAGWQMYTHLDERIDAMNKARQDEASVITDRISGLTVELKGLENGVKSGDGQSAKPAR